MTSSALGPRDAVVVVGAGPAGVGVLQGLRRAGHPGPVHLVGSEPGLPYDRPPLSKEALRDGAAPTPLADADELAALDPTLHLGRTAVGLDPATRAVTLDDGTVLAAAAVVLAPGAAPRTLPFLAGAPGVHVLRTAADAAALRADVLRESCLTVVGGGFLGCEAAASARALGAEVTLVELLDGPLVRVVGPQVAARVAALHLDRGVALRPGVAVTGVLPEGGGDPRRLLLSDGSTVDGRVVLLALGVVPDTAWLAGSGVGLGPDGAVLCDGTGATSVPGVRAAGDACSWSAPDGTRRRLEHWTAAVEQADVVARALLDPSTPPWEAVPYFWSDQHGSTVQAVGEVAPGTEAEVHPVGDGLVALHVVGDALRGVVALDARRLVGRARRLLRSGTDLDAARAALLR